MAMTADIASELWLPVLHALTTVTMLGVILTCQLVHYPLFQRVPPDSFHAYEREHMRRIFPLVAIAMALEGITAAWLAFAPPDALAAAGLTWLAWLGLALVAVNGVSTATLQGPIHQRLARNGHDHALIHRLVRTNGIRTAAWAIRSFIALLILAATAMGGSVQTA